MPILVYKKSKDLSEKIFNSLPEDYNFKLEHLNDLKKQNELSEDVVITEPENFNEDDLKFIRTNRRIVNLWNLEKLRTFLSNPKNEFRVLDPEKAINIIYNSEGTVEEEIVKVLSTKDSGYIIYLGKSPEFSMNNVFSKIDIFMGLLSKRFPRLEQLDKISRSIMMSKFFIDNFPSSQVEILEELGKICAELAFLRYKIQSGNVTLGTDGEISLSEITLKLEDMYKHLNGIFERLFDNMFFTFLSQFVSPPDLESNLTEDFLKMLISMSSKLDAACANFKIFKIGKRVLKKVMRYLPISYREKRKTMKSYKILYKKNLKNFKSRSFEINKTIIDEFVTFVIFLEGLRKTVENQLELINVFNNMPKVVWGIGELSELTFVDLKFLIPKLRKFYQAAPTFVQIRGDITLNKYDGPGGLIEKWATTVEMFREYDYRYKDEKMEKTLKAISDILNSFHKKVLELSQDVQKNVTIMNLIEQTIQTANVLSRISSRKIEISPKEMKKIYKNFALGVVETFKNLVNSIRKNKDIENQENVQVLAAWEYIKQRINVISKKGKREKFMRFLEIAIFLILLSLIVYLTIGNYIVTAIQKFLIDFLGFIFGV